MDRNVTKSVVEWTTQNCLDAGFQQFSLVFRADGYVLNGAGVKQHPWSKSSQHLVTKALDWTVSEIVRTNSKKVEFHCYEGGDYDKGIRGHHHAQVAISRDLDANTVLDRIKYLWNRKLEKAFKTEVSGSVHIEETRDAEGYSFYSQRREGSSLGSGSDKLVVSRSLRLLKRH